MYKFITIILLSFVFTGTAKAQPDKKDSLINKLAVTNIDTAKIIILNKLAIILHNKEPEKSLEYANEALKISEGNKYFEHLPETYGALAAANWVLSNYALGLDYLFKKLKIHEHKKEYKKIARTYSHIAIMLNASSKDSLALIYAKKSLDICTAHKYQIEKADGYNIIANINFQNDDTTKVEKYWTEALRIYKKAGKILKASSIEHNLAMLFYDKKEYGKALKLFQSTLKTCVEYNDVPCIASALENIGSTYEQTKNYNLAKKYYLQVLDTANKYDVPKIKMRAYFLLSDLNMTIKDYHAAYLDYKKYTNLKDSIFSQENEQEIAELQIKYETEKTEKENNLLRKEKKTNRLITILLTLSLLSVFLVLYFMWRMIKTKQANNIILTKKNKEILKQKQKIQENNEELRIQSEELILHEEHLQELVAERTRGLLKAEEKAKESDELKSAFLTNLSHEIRTPMNAIIGFTDLIAIPDLKDNERDEYLNVIQASSSRLLDLINDIIELSKIEVGKLKINKLEFSLDKTMQELLAKFSDKKTATVDLVYDHKVSGNGMLIYTDQVKFKQIMRNLLDNALKFTHSGTVNFGYTITDKQEFEFYVKDTGIGIAAEKQEIIFDRFRKIEGNNENLYPGTGLGLTIAKNLTEMLGGKMWFVSRPEKGSVFKFCLPYK